MGQLTASGLCSLELRIRIVRSADRYATSISMIETQLARRKDDLVSSGSKPVGVIIVLWV